MTADLAKVREYPHCTHGSTQAPNRDSVHLHICSLCTKRLWDQALQLADEVERLQGRHRASQEALTELLTEHRKQGEEKEKLVEALKDLVEYVEGSLSYMTNDEHPLDKARAAIPQPNPTETATEGGGVGRVIFVGATEAQIRWGGNDDPNKMCKVGKGYKIESQEVHSFHTKITLVGVEGSFNSVSFRPDGGDESG